MPKFAPVRGTGPAATAAARSVSTLATVTRLKPWPRRRLRRWPPRALGAACDVTGIPERIGGSLPGLGPRQPALGGRVGRRRGPVGAGGLPRGVVTVGCVLESLQGRHGHPQLFRRWKERVVGAVEGHAPRHRLARVTRDGLRRRAAAGRGGSRRRGGALDGGRAVQRGRVAPAGRVDPGCPAGVTFSSFASRLLPIGVLSRCRSEARGAFAVRPRKARWCLRRCARRRCRGPRAGSPREGCAAGGSRRGTRAERGWANRAPARGSFDSPERSRRRRRRRRSSSCPARTSARPVSSSARSSGWRSAPRPACPCRERLGMGKGIIGREVRETSRILRVRDRGFRTIGSASGWCSRELTHDAPHTAYVAMVEGGRCAIVGASPRGALCRCSSVVAHFLKSSSAAVPRMWGANKCQLCAQVIHLRGGAVRPGSFRGEVRGGWAETGSRDGDRTARRQPRTSPTAPRPGTASSTASRRSPTITPTTRPLGAGAERRITRGCCPR